MFNKDPCFVATDIIKQKMVGVLTQLRETSFLLCLLADTQNCRNSSLHLWNVLKGTNIKIIKFINKGKNINFILKIFKNIKNEAHREIIIDL